MSQIQSTSSGSDVPAPSIRSRAVTGSAWTAGGYVAGQALRMVANIILARLLFPEAFGLAGMVAVFIQGLEMISDMGIGLSIVQHREGNQRKFLNTAWTLQVIRGVVLWLAACAITWPVGIFYSPDLVELLPIGGLVAVLAGFNSTALFGQRRELAYKRLTVLTFASQAAAAVVMIVYAAIVPTVWALVAGMLAAGLVRLVLSHAILPGEGDRFGWDKEALGELRRFGKWVFLSSGLTFLALSADRLVLGQLTTEAVLGVYFVAFSVATVPSQLVAFVAGAVFMPALSESYRRDPGGIGPKFHRSRGALLKVGALALIGVAVMSEPFFRLIYREEFHEAGWMARWMTLAGWFTLLQMTGDRLLLAMGQSRALAVANAVNVLLTFGLGVWGFRAYGVPGFILGYAAGNAGGYLVIVAALSRRGVHVLLRDTVATVVCVAFALGTVELGRWAGGGSAWWMAGVSCGVMLLVCPAVLLKVKREVRVA